MKLVGICSDCRATSNGIYECSIATVQCYCLRSSLYMPRLLRCPYRLFKFRDRDQVSQRRGKLTSLLKSVKPSGKNLLPPLGVRYSVDLTASPEGVGKNLKPSFVF